ncbi:MAG: hypothetical protein ACI8PB_001808 [Desulforhopalus sp.]|jgi:hypothetical protein
MTREIRLSYYAEVNEMLIQLQKVCEEEIKRNPSLYAQRYRGIPQIRKESVNGSDPKILKPNFVYTGEYQKVFSGLQFTSPPLNSETNEVVCQESDILAHYTRRLIGKLMGEFHLGPLWEVSSSTLDTEQKLDYILLYLKAFIAAAQKRARETPDDLSK